MNKIFLHLWLFTLGRSILHSCTQNEAVPDVESQDQENEITFQTNENASRAFIDGNLSTPGTKMQIYGYHDKKYLADGQDKELSGKPLACIATDSWAVVDNNDNPITYFWEGEGTYRFFGWLTYDEAHSLQNPLTTNYFESESEKKLTVSGTTNLKDYNQFDFLYSEIDERTMDANNMDREKRRAVSLDMKHLFTAFAIGIKNTSEDDIDIKSVKLNCVNDNGSAEINYGPGLYTIVYGTTTQTAKPFVSFSGSHTLTKRTGYLPNIFNPSDAEKQFYMVWPQQGTVLNADGFSLGEDDEEEDETEANKRDANSPLLLEYMVDGVSFKKRLRLPNENWLPGKKYYLEVLIADKLVELACTVLDWDYTDAKVDFSENSVVVKEGNHLKWDEQKCTVYPDLKKVYVKNAAPVEATFCIDAPQGGQWRVSLEGDVTKFKIIDDADPNDDGFGPIDGKLHRIKIRPTETSPERDYKVTLKFVAITADRSKILPADDMIQKAGKDTIVLPRVK